MTTNTAPDYATRNWLTIEEELELAREQREYLQDSETLWEELND